MRSKVREVSSKYYEANENKEKCSEGDDVAKETAIENEKDIEEVSTEIKKGLEIIFVEQLQDVLDVALVKWWEIA